MLIGIPTDDQDTRDVRRSLSQQKLSDIHETLNQSAPADLKPALTISPAQQTEARQLSHSIFENWSTIHLVVERYGPTIRKRWFKRTREQRRRVLLAAWPDMPAHHRPDLEAFRREKNSGPAGSFGPYLWPHLSQEDLLNPKAFLIFLNARGRNPPPAFSGADADSSAFGSVMEKLEVPYMSGYSVLFAGRDTPRHMASWSRSWGNHETTSSQSRIPPGTTPGMDLLVLQVQDRIYRFLRDCGQELLRYMDLSTTTLGDAPETILIETRHKFAGRSRR